MRVPVVSVAAVSRYKSKRKLGVAVFQAIEAGSKLSLRVVREFLGYLSKGQLQPGDRLPSEAELSRQWNVGVSSVREALAVLDGLGVTQVRQGAGREVRGLTFAALADPRIGPALVDGEMLLDLYEVRLTVESQIVRSAAERATEDEIVGLRAAAERMIARVAEGEDGLDEDGAFHRALAQSSNNRVFGWIDDAVGFLTREARRTGLGHTGRPATAAAEHVEIVDAIARRDADAAEALIVKHLAPTWADAMEWLKNGSV